MTLNELNFHDLIQYELSDPNKYSFEDYARNGNVHPQIRGYCTACEERGVNICKEDSAFSLRNISHGAHSRDFITTMGIKDDLAEWNNKGVVFVMECPSVHDEIYISTEIEKDGKMFCKCPTKKWYWIHDEIRECRYPDYFKGRQYGELIASIIATFKLSNAYLTNLIKCGLNDKDGKRYKGIAAYEPGCIECCCDRFFKKEIELMEPKVIFTFGSRVYEEVKICLRNRENVVVVGLPHPARRRGGFKDEYYNVLYYCMIAKWLYKTGVIDKQFYTEKMERFAEEN